ncbi:PF07600 family protein, partial [Leptospira kirschneri]
MDILLFDDGQKIESTLIEGVVGTDSLLVPEVYWNRLSPQERKVLRNRLPFLLRKYSKKIASMTRLHDKAGKIKYNLGVGKMKKFSIRVHTGVWATLGVLAAAHGVSRCYLFNYMLW